MPFPLSSIVIEEKNKLATDSVFLLALKITIPGVAEPVRLVRNNENITWDSETWYAIHFEIDQVRDEKGEVPQVTLQVSNVSRAMEAYIQAFDIYTKINGYSPITVVIYVLNTKDLANPTPVREMELELKQPKTDSKFATFILGATNPFNQRFPKKRILKNHCNHNFNYPDGTDPWCGYTETGLGFINCPGKTLQECRARNNSARFGGFLGVGYGGVRVPS